MKVDFTLFFFAFFLVAAVVGWDWPNIAKIMPVYVAAIPGLVLAAVQLYRNATNWEQRNGKVSGAIFSSSRRVSIWPCATPGTMRMNTSSTNAGRD